MQSGMIHSDMFPVNSCNRPLDVLEKISLTIRTTDRQGTPVTRKIPDFELFNDKESVHTFTGKENRAILTVLRSFLLLFCLVPNDLQQIQVRERSAVLSLLFAHVISFVGYCV